MSDDLPDAPWATKADDSLPDAPWASGGLKPEAADHGLSERQKLSPLGKALSPITSYPETYQRMNKEAREQVSHGVKQLTGPNVGDLSSGDLLKGVGNVAAGSIGYVASPVSAAYRSVIGQPVEDVTGIPREITEFGAQLATPGMGLVKGPFKEPPKIVPVKPEANGPLGVTLSEGQLTHEMPTIRRESAARTGQLGPEAEQTAREFAEQQAPQIEAAREKVQRGMDPHGGQVLAESPYEAAELAGETFRKEAARAKAGVKGAYDEAKALPGEIEAQAVVGLGNRVKNILGTMDDVIVDPQLTPFSAKMIDSIDDTISKLRIPNKAELNAPDRMEIAGVTLRGIEQARKKLSEFRRGAYGSGNATDGRAASAVMEAFDDAITNAINGGYFRGDPRAIQAWNDARAAHADYKTTFGKGKRDPVGNVVQKVIGDSTNPPATANAIADHLYGASGVNPSDLNIGVAKRFKKVLGESSPEWAAVRQGLFERLTSKGEGVTDYGSTNIANRLNKFLNVDGKDLAAVLFTPEQRNLMQQYADLHRALEVPKGGYNSSETSTFVVPMIQKASKYIMGAIGAMIGHTIAPGMYGAGEAAGAYAAAKGSDFVSNRLNAKAIQAQMPIIEKQLAAWRKEVTRSQGNTTPALTTRTLALSQALERVGVDGSFIRQLQGPIPAAAEKNQQQGKRPLNDQKDQGAGGKSHGGPVNRADGGAVHNHSPTEAQKEAGNYAKTHRYFHGLDITIENLRGKPRSGVGKDGKKWSVTMPAHYGYIKRTEGADGDHVDVYLGPNEKSDQVFVVDQKDAETGKFDEHKCLLGFNSEAEARKTYRAGFSDGKDRIKHLRRMSMAEFKDWLAKGDTSKEIRRYASGGAVRRALQSLKSYADGGDVEDKSPFDWSGVGAAMPENIGLDKIMDPLITIPKRIGYDLPKELIEHSQANPLPGLRREDYTDVPADTSPDPRSPLAGVGIAAPKVGWQPVDPMVGGSLEAAGNVMGTAAPLASNISKAGEVSLGVVPVDVGKAFNVAPKIPDTDLFRQAVKNTPGASLDGDALVLSVSRRQRPEQELEESVRGGVFYLPKGSKDQKYYTGTKENFQYGGLQPVEGETAVKAPLFVKGATGGKAPEAAYDQLMGKGAYQEMRADALHHTPYYFKPAEKEEAVSKFLEKYAPEMVGKEYLILQNSKKGNQLAYALQEAAVASAARRAGHDSIIGYSTKRGPGKEPFISEIFDVRESHYPSPAGDYQTWPSEMFGRKSGGRVRDRSVALKVAYGTKGRRNG